jgi:hypothetical protein
MITLQGFEQFIPFVKPLFDGMRSARDFFRKPDRKNSERGEEDRRILADIMNIVGSRAIIFLRSADFAYAFSLNEIEGIGIMAFDRRGAEHEFIDPELELLRKRLVLTV